MRADNMASRYKETKVDGEVYFLCATTKPYLFEGLPGRDPSWGGVDDCLKGDAPRMGELLPEAKRLLGVLRFWALGGGKPCPGAP